MGRGQDFYPILFFHFLSIMLKKYISNDQPKFECQSLNHIYLGLKLQFSLEHSKRKQNHDVSFLYMTKKFELCISLTAQRLTLIIWLTIEILYFKNSKRKKKIFDDNRHHVSFLFNLIFSSLI